MRLILKYKELREIIQEVEVNINPDDYGLIIDDDGNINKEAFYNNYNSELYSELYPDIINDPDIIFSKIMTQLGEDAWDYIKTNKYEINFDIDEIPNMEYDFLIYDLEDNLIFSEND